MDIHKIKPVHGWREFFGEVGIIVLGVLIALGAEQLVEAIHWRHRVEAGRETLTFDLADKLWIAREREWSSYCLSRRLESLAGVFTQATKTHRLPAIASFKAPPSRVWLIDSWNSLIADGTATHFSREDRIIFSRLANYAQSITDYNREEIRLWSSLQAVAGPGRTVDDVEIGQLIETLQQAGVHSARMRRVAAQVRRIIENSSLPVDREFRAQLTGNGKPDHGRARTDCSGYDAGETIAHYGYSEKLRQALEDRLAPAQ